MDGSLGRSAAGDQDLSICPRLLRWPQQKGRCPAPIRVPIELAMPIEVVDRRRIRVALVESAHLVGWIDGRRCSRLFPSHVRLFAPFLHRPLCNRHGAAAGEPERPPLDPVRLGYEWVALLHLAEHLVEVEAGGLLALRVFPECLQEFPDIGLRRHQQVDVIDKPIVVGDRGDVGALEGIRAEIKDLWHAKGDKRLGPDAQRAGLPLFREHELPIVVAQRHDLLVVIAVDERDPRALLRLAGQVRHQIIAVEVDLVGHVADRVALQAACR